MSGIVDHVDAVDEADRFEKVLALRERKLRRLPGRGDDGVVAPEIHPQPPALCRLVEEAEIAQPQVIERAGNDGDDVTHVAGFSARILILNEPSTGSSDAMIMYPPPQPLNIAPA